MSRKAGDEESWSKGKMERRGGNITDKREVEALSAMRVKFELLEGGKDGWRWKQSGILVIRGLLGHDCLRS